MFIYMSFVFLSGPLQWLAISAFIVKYWLRSEREDQFMSQSNPEYLAYKKQVPWKFIPGIY
jgi:protein-S-isoprenylcysteine O-methyltransferase Ste14